MTCYFLIISMSHKSLIQHFSNLKILCYAELLTVASTSLEPLIITVPPNHQTGFLCCSSISTEPKNQYITGSKMNRPNTDANATAVFLTLLLTHYQTKGTRNYFLIIRNVAGGWSDDHTKAVAGILVVVPFVLQSAATSLKNCGTVPARQPGASGSQAWRCSD